MSKPIDIIGKRVGRLVVIKEDLDRPAVFSIYKGYKRQIPHYYCQCDCGNVVSVRKHLLGNNKKQTKSCGCLQKEIFIKINKRRRFPTGVKPLNELIHNYVLRAKNGNYPFSLTREQFVCLIKQPCYYCGSEPTKQERAHWKRQNDFLIFNGIDRIDSSAGYTMDNVVPCCSDCNYAKSDLSQTEFFTLVGKIYNIHKSEIDA